MALVQRVISILLYGNGCHKQVNFSQIKLIEDMLIKIFNLPGVQLSTTLDGLSV